MEVLGFRRVCAVDSCLFCEVIDRSLQGTLYVRHFEQVERCIPDIHCRWHTNCYMYHQHTMSMLMICTCGPTALPLRLPDFNKCHCFLKCCSCDMLLYHFFPSLKLNMTLCLCAAHM